MRVALTLCVVGLLAFAAPAAVAKPAGSGLTASIGEREVDLAFAELHKPTVLYRDGAALATLPRGATAYADRDVAPGGRYSYAVGAERVDVELPAYLVGAATADITPSGPVNLGGFGLGDGRAGHSDASDLIYNQACSEALNQSKQPNYTGPELCAVPGKDGFFRVVQATAPGGGVVATYAAYAAHATAGGGSGLHGDW